MSIQALSNVWARSSAKGGTLLVFLALADGADLEGAAFPSEQWIAEKSRMSERHVRRALSDLCAAGELERWEWRDKSRGVRHNAYRILLGDWEALRGVPPEALTDRAREGSLRRKLTQEQRTRIMERDDYTCQCCGVRVQLQIDHIVPSSKGGSDEDENLQVLCAPCNQAKGDRPTCPLHVTARLPDTGVRYVPDAEVRQLPDADVRSHARVGSSKDPSKEPAASRPRDEVWDELERLFGEVAPKTNAHAKRNRAVADLKRLGATAETLVLAYAAWSGVFPGTTITDVALATHYPQLFRAARPSQPKAPPCPECGVGGGLHVADCSLASTGAAA